MTKIERKMLVNQFSILEALDQANKTEYERKGKILTNGYTSQYADVFAGIYDEVPEDECSYVHDVLDMHRALKQSYDALPDKEGLSEKDVEYRGFDGNNESRRLAYASFLNDEGRWKESDGKRNSHTQATISRYPRMLGKWKVLDDDRQWDMTAEDIKEVIQA